MKQLRRHILGGYLVLLAGVYLLLAVLIRAGFTGLPVLAMAAGINMAFQGIFLALLGPSRYLRPIPPWRLGLTSLYAATLLTLLLYAVWLTLDEAGVLSLRHDPEIVWALIVLTPATLITLLSLWCRGRERLVVLRRLGLTVLAGASLALAVTVPGYIVLMAQPTRGFLHGMGSLLALIAALQILAWSLGPLFVFLYCRRLRRMLKGKCLACGYELIGLSQMRCPECGRPFTLDEVNATAAELRFMHRTAGA